MKILDLTGRRFGKWTVQYLHGFIKPSTYKINFWLCECDCGVRKPIPTKNLTSGRSKSCGCNRERKLQHRYYCYPHGTTVYNQVELSPETE